MQQGGSPYGVLPPQQQQQQQQVEMSPFRFAVGGGGGAAEAAPPISTRPPPSPGRGVTSAAAAAPPPNYEESGIGDDPLGVPGDEGGSGVLSGNRWPRQETLALLKIRSDMDATFRDATLKGPLWEEVSRKLGELGYRRSAKKCKEKFENVHKYYKRTKEGRAGRQDGKSYRFFSQLEALQNTMAANTTPLLSPAPQPMAAAPTTFPQNNQAPAPSQAQAQAAVARAVHPMQISAPTPITTAPPAPQANPMSMFSGIPNAPGSSVGGVAAAAATGIGFSSNTSSSSGSESEDDDDEATEEGPCGGRKRKRESGGGGSKKMMAFFEGLMRQVMERQESMQQRFLEAIEKREQDRMIREEAWRRQEMSRLGHEQELAKQERAAAASRDATIISFLQKVTAQAVQLPPPPPSVGVSFAPPSTAILTPPTTAIQTAPNPPPASQIHLATPQPPPQQPHTDAARHHQPITPPPPHLPQQQQKQNTDPAQHHQSITPPLQPPAASSELVPMASSEVQEGTGASVSMDPTSSRWPKSEVHDLIKLRSGLDSRYQESGPKGPLWEEISAGMQRLGYNRSAKRCKEKWENINKYFKKVKESNKKRPEDAKTCPYFHQLDALYRSKHHNSGGGGGGGGDSSGCSSIPALTHQNSNLNPNPSPITMIAPPQVKHQGEMESKNGNGGNADQNSGGSSNGGMGSNFGTTAGGVGDNGGIMKKPEDIMKELMGQSTNSDYGNLNEPESDNMDEDDEEEDDEDDEDGKGQYRIQFQNVGNNNAGNGASTNTGGKTSGTFLAMVR